jgi:hypothetical protein
VPLTTAQLVPFIEVAIDSVPPPQTATHIEPFHATPRPEVNNPVGIVVIPVHLIPSNECAIEFTTSPTATHIEPLHATP